MVIPTLDQTEGVWIGRTSDQGYHFMQEVFPGKTQREQWHQSNCQLLIAQGHLQPERGDDQEQSQRQWDSTQRYVRVHT